MTSKDRQNYEQGPPVGAEIVIEPKVATEREPEQGEPPTVVPDGSQTVDIRRFSTALAQVQGEVKNAKKSQKNEHFKTSYADLVEITDACRFSLSRHLIAVLQVPILDDQGGMILRTRLMHGPSGQFVRGDYPLAVGAKAAAQAKVGELTYARRASVACMVWVSSEDDDDGESIGDRDRPQEEGQPRGVEKSKATREMEEWADWAAGRKIPNIKTADDLTAWEEGVNKEIAALAKNAPDHHQKVKEALAAAAVRLALPQGEPGA